MSRTTSAWTRLRSVYQRTIGTPAVPVKPLLTIGAVSNKEIICGSPGTDYQTDWAAISNANSFDVQALGSDFPTDPMKGSVATISAIPDLGTIYRVIQSTIRRDGIVYFSLGASTRAPSTSSTRVTTSGDTRVTTSGDIRVTV